MRFKTCTPLILLILLFFTGCESDKNPGKALVIENNTTERIFYWYSDSNEHHYPNISLPINLPVNVFSVGPNNSQTASNIDPNWHSIFNQTPEGKLTVYFFAFLPNSQEEWNEVVETMDTIGRKDVTLEELKSTNYIISFP